VPEHEPILVDTDVASALYLERYYGRQVPASLTGILATRRLAISVISLGEDHYGARKRKWGPQRTSCMLVFYQEMFDVVSLVDDDTAAEYGTVLLNQLTGYDDISSHPGPGLFRTRYGTRTSGRCRRCWPARPPSQRSMPPMNRCSPARTTTSSGRPASATVATTLPTTALQYVDHATSWDDFAVRGSLADGKFVGFYLVGGLIRAAVGFDRGGDPEWEPDSEMAACAGLVARRARPDRAALTDEGVDHRSSPA
jgi:Reductase C-terminal